MQLVGLDNQDLFISDEHFDNTSDISETELEGRFLILESDWFLEPHKIAKNMLVRAIGGFGCSPHALGRAIYVEFSDAVSDRISIHDICRVVKEGHEETVKKVLLNNELRFTHYEWE